MLCVRAWVWRDGGAAHAGGLLGAPSPHPQLSPRPYPLPLLLSPQIANMPDMGGLNGLSVAAPLLCPIDEQNPDQPQTAAAAAAAVAAAGVLQGALIGLGGAANPSHLQSLQMTTQFPMGEGGGAYGGHQQH
jgi:hypothetical protein